MTKQEKREKAIEEIVNILDDTDKCAVSFCQSGVSCNECEASLIYDKVILRKEEEVRKETIKEFVETVKRCLPNEPYLHTWLREIAFGKFGVEVEE